MDGGDVLQFGNQFLVGNSTRTNEAGIQCLKDFVEARGFTMHVIQVPSNSLHLISICTSPVPGVLLASEPPTFLKPFLSLQDYQSLP